MKNKKISLTAILLFYTTFIFSQQSLISGIVRDSINGQSISYVAVYLLDVKDSILYHTYTDDDGNFILSSKNFKNGTIRAEMLGYKKWQKKISDLQEGNVLNDTILMMQETYMLSDVEITGKINQIVRKLDRTIVNIEQKEIEKANTIYDIIKTIPGVVVDETTNSIRFKGSSPEILVNNMPAKYVYPDLKQIDIYNINNIELIDRSSIYGGTGEGGIINIKLKKDKKQESFGMYLGTISMYGIKDKIFIPSQEMLNINVNIGNITVFNNLFFDSYITKNKVEGYGILKLDDKDFNRSSIENKSYSQSNVSDILGVMFYLGEIDVLIANQFMYSKWHIKENVFQTTFLDPDYCSKMSQKKEMYNNYSFNQAIAQLSLSDFNNQDFEFLFSMTNSCFNNPQTDKIETISDIYQNQKNTNYSENTMIKSIFDINMYDASFYYLYRPAQNTQLNIHANYSQGEAPIYNKDYFINEIENMNLKEISNFKITQLPFGIGLIQRFKRFSMGITVNYKYQQFKGNFKRHINTNDSTLVLNMKFHNIEPSVRVKYNIDSINDIYLGYSYTTSDLENNDWSKPMSYYVPYIDKSNSIQWKSGNENLKLEKYHKLYFQYRLTKNLLKFTTEIFCSVTNNGISLVSIPISTETALSIPENIAFMSRIGTDISFYYKISDRLRTSLNGQIYHSTSKVNALNIISEVYNVDKEDIKQNNFESNANLILQYYLKTKIGKKPNMILCLNTYSKEISITGYIEPYLTSSISFRSNFFKEKLFFSLDMENILYSYNKRKSHYNHLGYMANYTTTSSENNMVVKLTLGLNLFAGERDTKDIRF